MRVLPPFFAIALTCLTGCSDRSPVAPSDALTILKGVVISDARRESTAAPASNRLALQLSNADFAYVSIAPQTLAASTNVEISNRTKKLPASVFSLTDGGLDPVAVEADAGDTLELNVWHNDGSQQPILVKVPTKRPPSVVRTSPPKGRTDVALNVVVTVIFTEPVDSQTVNASSVQLLRNGKPVTGRTVLEDDLWTADFIPDVPLDPDAAYDVRVTPTIHDLDGDVLDSTYTSTFVTGSGECDPAFDMSACASSTGRVVTGSVVDRTDGGSTPVPLAIVDAWAQSPDGNGSRLARVRTDANGHFAIIVPVGATAQLHAFVPGYDQPCGVSAGASVTNLETDIEVVSIKAPRPAAAISHQRIWGYVLELTPDPSRDNQLLLAVPVAAARLFLEGPKGFLAASTSSDDQGVYSFCRAPVFDQLILSATKSGYADFTKTLSFSGLPDVPLGVFMSR